MNDDLALATIVAFCVVGIAQFFPDVVSLVADPKKVVYSAVFSTTITTLLVLIFDGRDPPTKPEGRA